ncbi:MAG: excinuclease ABC subunit UvrC [Candidatus Tectomicrobia bacterium]|uniref:UvrABC system protein C n=1 Tax=Tectimicrobiota bacterium TaxID=2528274 RepID=A0A932MM57_UNCTE|nr:excinuclease ABC subunit UvrC [Candidatus Tectomicrobia bacterium]
MQDQAETVRGDLQEAVRRLPDGPGIYIFKGAGGEFLYVGKATRLRSRVRSYFARRLDRSPWIARMVEDIASIEHVTTSNEVEALILESNYIKRHRPKHNVLLRDDKHFPYLKMSTQEDYPRLSVVRRPAGDGADYLGPFPSPGNLRRTIRFLQKSFHIRACTGGIEDKTSKRCIYFQMGQCLGPCDGLQGQEEYRAGVEDALDFLRGRSTEVVARLRAGMEREAEALRFEAAAKIRDRIRDIEELTAQQRQRVASAREADQDILGLHREGGRAVFRMFFVRGGRLLGDQVFSLAAPAELPGGEVVSSFMKQYYASQSFLPAEVLLPAAPPDAEVIARWLAGRKDRKVEVLTPRRGDKRRLVEMACENAAQSAEGEAAAVLKEQAALGAVQRALGLEGPPALIEAFDISNLRGSHIVGASVAFRDGKPLKDSYRRYRVRSVAGSADDFASMREIVLRRVERLVNEGGEMPGLILIDGGKGQLSAAAAALEEAGAADVGLAAISKGRTADNPTDQDVFYLPGRSEPVRMEEGSPGKLLLQRIRDEVHRFVLTYHRARRSSGELRSGLDDVPGLGPKRRRNLLRAFGSLRGVLDAGDAQLLAVPGITPAVVAALREKLGGGPAAEEAP